MGKPSITDPDPGVARRALGNAVVDTVTGGYPLLGGSSATAEGDSVAATATPTGNTDAMVPVAGEDLRGKVPPFHPGVAGDTSMVDSVYGEEANREGAAQNIFPTLEQKPRGPGNTVQGEGENFLPTRGRDLFEETYVKGPQRLAEAQGEVGRLSANKSEALSQKYGQQAQQAQEAMAANQVRRQADDQEINIRQQQLQDATQHYTQDLQDQNKFWASPGNIVSAIAFSLMPIFSNDPAIGVKLINQAIDRDMTNRKDLANMHLGELRSNVGMYRKLADDRNVGDQLAQAEAHRVAAMDIERISAQFDSPIAKAKAQAMIQDQLMRAGQVQQTAYNHFNYNTVRALDPRMAKAFEAPGKAGNEDAWKSFTLPAGSAGNVVGNVQGTPSTARDTSGGTTSLNNMAPAQVVALSYQPDQIAKMAMDGKMDGKELQTMFRNSVVARARASVDQSSPKYELLFNQKVEDLRKGAEAGVSQIAKAAQPAAKGIAITSRIAQDMATIEAECAEAGVNPNEFLGELRTGLGGPAAAKINDLRLKLNNDATDNASQKLAMDRLRASERFHQALAGKVIEFYHTNAGAAQNATETGNLKQVISTDASWDKIRNFVGLESQQYAAEYRGALRSADSPYSAILYLANNGNALKQLPRNGISAPAVRQPVDQYRGDRPQGKGTPTPLASPGTVPPPRGFQPENGPFAP